MGGAAACQRTRAEKKEKRGEEEREEREEEGRRKRETQKGFSKATKRPSAPTSDGGVLIKMGATPNKICRYRPQTLPGWF